MILVNTKNIKKWLNLVLSQFVKLCKKTEKFKLIATNSPAVSPDGTITHSQVLTFMKKQPKTITMYNEITTSGDNSIILSGDHVMYARKSDKEKFMAM